MSKKTNKPLTEKEGNVTVKIYCRTRRVAGNDYQTFEVCDYTTGKRILRSHSTESEARKEAKRIAKALAAGNVRSAQMLSRDVASYGRAIELAKPTGVPLEIVAAHYAEAFKILGSDRIIEAAKFFVAQNPDTLTRRTVAEVVAEMIAAKETRGASKRYVQDLRARLNRFAEAFKEDMASVTTADLQRWFDGLKLSAQSLKNYRTVISTLFTFAEQRGYVFKGSNPVQGTEKVSAKNGEPVEIFTPTEIAKLLSKAPQNFVACLALGAFAGLRSAEIERMEWQDVDLKAGHIVVAAEKAKTASRRIVPILPNLSAWLAPYVRKAGKIWAGLHDEFYEAQQTTATDAGIKWKSNALRHSFISYRLASIQNAAQVALEAGNSTAVVFGHYRELVKSADAKKWFSIKPTRAANVVQLEARTA